jgi:hypothetical protein
MVVGRRARGAAMVLGLLGLVGALALAMAAGGCSSEEDLTTWIPGYTGGQAVGPDGTLVFQAHTFSNDVYVTMPAVERVGLAATPSGACVGCILFEVTGNPTFQIPASARFRLFGAAQTPGADLKVYERYAGADTQVGTAEVASDGATAWLESAIGRGGLYVVAAAPSP